MVAEDADDLGVVAFRTFAYGARFRFHGTVFRRKLLGSPSAAASWWTPSTTTMWTARGNAPTQNLSIQLRDGGTGWPMYGPGIRWSP